MIYSPGGLDTIRLRRLTRPRGTSSLVIEQANSPYQDELTGAGLDTLSNSICRAYATSPLIEWINKML